MTYTMDQIVRSMNCRSNIYGRPMDDPLFGVVITDQMIAAAQGIEAQRATTVQQGVVHESPVGEADAP